MLYYWISWQAETASLTFPFIIREFLEKTPLTAMQLHWCWKRRGHSGIRIMGAVNCEIRWQKDEKHKQTF